MPGPRNDPPPLSSPALAARRLPPPDEPSVPPSGASVRLRALAALSGSLTDALGPQDAADLVEQQALFALGATSAVVVTLGTFPPPLATAAGAPAEAALHVVHAIGLPLEVRAALDALPLDAPVPFAEVARTGAPLFLPTTTRSGCTRTGAPPWSAPARARRRSCRCGRTASCAACSASRGRSRARSTRTSARSCSRWA
jgi:hypothetical protein